MSQIGTVYGQALYDLALEEGLTESILQQLQIVKSCLDEEPQYLELLSSAALSKAERCQLLQESMSALHPYLLNFLKILTEKGYMRRFADCQSTYQQCYYRDNNMLPVSAVTAIALSAPQSEKLQARLSELTGKTVLLSNKVDTSLLGGIRLDYDGKQIDDTIAHRLDSVRQLLKNTVL